jgi:hypothetical protein
VDSNGPGRKVEELSRILVALEERLLGLIQQRAAGAVLFGDFASRLGVLLADLKRCYTSLVELSERQDVTFRITRALRYIDAECVWLFRKIHQERLMFWKFTLETRLRGRVSEEAFTLHQALLGADEEEREYCSMDARRIRRMLLGEQGDIPETGSAG